MTVVSITILIYRFKKIINKKRNSMAICLARIGLLISIASFFISIIAESMIQSNFNEINHPCKNYNNQNNDVIYFRNIRILSNDNNKELCKGKNNNYDAKICSNLEYTISYLCATIIELSTLILIFLWFNDLRRLKEKVDGMLTIYGGSTYLSKNNYIENRNINFKENDDNKNNEINEFDSVNRYFNNNQNSNSIQSKVISVKNNNKNNPRLSQPINLNFNNNTNHNNNYINNLRKEMKEGIESIDEEESSENKDNDNVNYNNKEQIDISIYGSRHKNNYPKGDNVYNKNKKNEIEGNITNIEEENEENSNELPDLYIPNK